ncbi:PAS domain-containing protein [Desulfoferrobacter suflitae]|uniref:PAS domain-containing protein n=1 Tax=Desulfoferrobacter suflitae TaxID=2865782 RepID=UPI0021641127|nr:histidine kinase [Desulfoferrobacter suflitae]MCK8603650.1 histidine kinase [Desulfoferrobacter suflitae]
MRLFTFASLRIRLLALIMSAILPALGWALYTGFEERLIQRSLVEENVLRLTRLAAGDLVQAIEGARQLLIGLSQLPEVFPNNSAVCSAVFANLLKQYPYYTNLGVLDAKGNLFCSARPTVEMVNLADKPFIAAALRTNGFLMSGYQLDAITGQAVISFGYPVYGQTQKLQALVFTNLDLAWFKQLEVEAQLPLEAALIVIDAEGTILARYPDPEKWVGRKLPENRISQMVHSEREESMVEARGLDNIPRLYGITTVQGAPGNNLYVSIGVSKKTAFAPVDRVFMRNLIGIALVGATALLATWFGGEIFILRRLDELVRATKRLANGDLTARIGPPYDGDEIGMLADSFDDMAESLEQRTAELNRAETKYRTLVEQIPMVTYVTPVDKTAGTLYISPQVEAILGFSPKEWLADAELWRRQLHPEDRDRVLTEMHGDPHTACVIGFRSEYRMLSKDNRTVWLHDEAVLMKTEQENRQFLQGILIDISDQKRVEQQLKISSEQMRELAAHIEAIREEERTRIAREIHDELGQALTGLKMDLSWLDKKIADGGGGIPFERLLDKTAAMKKLIDETIQAVRKISTELRPGILDDLGLIAAIEWQASDFQARTGIPCVVLTQVNEDLPVDEKNSSAVFRIFQEILTNVARHANASRIDISLKEEAQQLVLKVQDNGRGVTEKESCSVKSLGILGMRERTLLLGGEFSIVGIPSRGTTVTVRIPLGVAPM